MMVYDDGLRRCRMHGIAVLCTAQDQLFDKLLVVTTLNLEGDVWHIHCSGILWVRPGGVTW